MATTRRRRFSPGARRRQRGPGSTCATMRRSAALEAVRRIELLSDIERGVNGKAAGQRLAARQELSASVLADLNQYG